MSYKSLHGGSRSCGCLRDELAKARATRHGGSYSVEYKTWASMKRRCYIPTERVYAFYGARGIKVCDRWLAGFDNFLADMGRRPSPHHSIERKDNDGPYSPENCVWATTREQGRNKRRLRFLEYRGERMHVTAWAERTGIRATTLFERLARGWSIERTLETRVR